MVAIKKQDVRTTIQIKILRGGCAMKMELKNNKLNRRSINSFWYYYFMKVDL